MTPGRKRFFTPARTAFAWLVAIGLCTGCGGSSETSGGTANTNASSGSSGGARTRAYDERDGGAQGAGASNAANAADASTGRSDARASSDAGRPDASTEFSVQGDPQQTGFDVSGSSDLPAAPTSTMQPYARIIESAVAPSRAALAECLRPLGPPLRRYYRLTVETNGQLVPRPPQPSPLPSDVGDCVEALLRNVVVSPPPPRETPYDLIITVTP